MQLLQLSFLTVVIFFVPVAGDCVKIEETTKSYWLTSGQHDLYASLLRHHDIAEARNVILFVAGGLTTSFVAQARRFLHSELDDFERFQFESFPYVGLHKSRSLDDASTANSYLTGVQGQSGTIGLGPEVARGDCETSEAHPVESLADWFLAKDKDVGFVTNGRVTYGSVSPLYAHSAEAEWEADVDGRPCRDIGYQLIHRYPGRELKVILGGGRANFYPDYLPDPIVKGENGKRGDARRLADEWLFKSGRRKYVMTAQELKEVDFNKTDYLFGLFAPSHLQYVSERSLDSTEPNITQMLDSAISFLQTPSSSHGFFLLVDSNRVQVGGFPMTFSGPRIGHALEEKEPRKAFRELEDFNAAIALACRRMNMEQTLIVVTGTNSPAYLLTKQETKTPPLRRQSFRQRLATRQSNAQSLALEVGQSDCVPAQGEDMPVFASGPLAYLFTSSYPSTDLAHFLACAGLAGPSRGACKGFIDRNSRCYH